MAKEESKVEAPVSPAKAEMLKIIEAYKKANPKKYELKKAELERKLAACQ